MDKNSPDLLPSVQPPQSPNNGENFRAPQETYPQNIETHNEREQSQAVERGISTPQMNTNNQGGVYSAPVQAGDPALPATPVYVPGGDNPQIAEDADLIEDEWVDKAKEIVERTSQDPHQQNKEMNLVKADYLKKRYNKDIKVSEDHQ